MIGEVPRTGRGTWTSAPCAVYLIYLIDRCRAEGVSTPHGRFLGFPARSRGRVGRLLSRSSRQGASAPRVAFDAGRFLLVARDAYEAVLRAYVAGNLDRLADRLEDRLLAEFATDIRRRGPGLRRLSVAFVTPTVCEIVSRDFDKSTSIVTVRFESMFLIGRRDIGPERSSEDLARLLQAAEVWTFQKKRTGKRAPWKIIAIRNA